MSFEVGNGTAIKGMLITDSSARVDAPDLVMQRSASLIIFSKLFSKLKILFSMLFLE